MNWIKKLIPGFIEVRSLYWIQYNAKMERALVGIFAALDDDQYDKARDLILEFKKNFSQQNVPHWVALNYAEIYKATSMYSFMTNQS